MLHQRRASQARKGRVLLGGDALHSDNPIGGLGPTTGVLNAIAYGMSSCETSKEESLGLSLWLEPSREGKLLSTQPIRRQLSICESFSLFPRRIRRIEWRKTLGLLRR